MTFLSILSILIVVILAFILVGIVGGAFRVLGFGGLQVAIILVATLLGSAVNIPIGTLKSFHPLLQVGDISVFGVTFRIPQVAYGVSTTRLAVNLGGAVIPTTVSLYLLWRTPGALLPALLGVAIVAVVTHLVSRPVRGLGIVTPSLIPPLAAALSALSIPSIQPYIVAYTSGVLGTLLGADLSNLHKISDLGAPMASIGGAGTFDGVFLSGIIAVLLA